MPCLKQALPVGSLSHGINTGTGGWVRVDCLLPLRLQSAGTMCQSLVVGLGVLPGGWLPPSGGGMVTFVEVFVPERDFRHSGFIPRLVTSVCY